ncbi:hypothetical protein CYMTET_31332, partial [Cymbomonas tetramitiformis]
DVRAIATLTRAIIGTKTATGATCWKKFTAVTALVVLAESWQALLCSPCCFYNACFYRPSSQLAACTRWLHPSPRARRCSPCVLSPSTFGRWRLARFMLLLHGATSFLAPLAHEPISHGASWRCRARISRRVVE